MSQIRGDRNPSAEYEETNKSENIGAKSLNYMQQQAKLREGYRNFASFVSNRPGHQHLKTNSVSYQNCDSTQLAYPSAVKVEEAPT